MRMRPAVGQLKHEMPFKIKNNFCLKHLNILFLTMPCLFILIIRPFNFHEYFLYKMISMFHICQTPRYGSLFMLSLDSGSLQNNVEKNKSSYNY